MIDESLDVTSWWFAHFGWNAHLFYKKIWNPKQNCSFYIFPMETNQMFIGYNDFMGAIHGLHHMKCDLNVC
jgi:hypothetical protein